MRAVVDEKGRKEIRTKSSAPLYFIYCCILATLYKYMHQYEALYTVGEIIVKVMK